MQHRLIVGIALAAMGFGGWWWWQDSRAAANHAIRGSGIIEVTEVDVAFEVPGTVIERLVDEGASLDRGEPIARLDEREYRLQAERAAAALAAAQARYTLLKNGARGQEIDQALAAMDTALSQYTLQEKELARARELLASGVMSRAEYDRISTAHATALGTRDRAAAQLALLREGSRTEELEEGRARLHEAEKALALAELNLSRCNLFAPISGRVLSKNREAGETVSPGASIVTLGDLEHPWLNLYVSERDLGRVALGMPAQVVVDAFPDEPFPGRVSYIADKSEFTPKNIQTQDERVKLVYRVKIELVNRNGALKPGMPADAAILLDDRPPSS